MGKRWPICLPVNAILTHSMTLKQKQKTTSLMDPLIIARIHSGSLILLLK
jgi:hypothetical protein